VAVDDSVRGSADYPAVPVRPVRHPVASYGD
jgi:hypothetical protein